MNKVPAVMTPVTEYIVNLSILCDNKETLQRVIDDLRAATRSDMDIELLFSGDSSGTYGDVFQKHLKCATAFNAKARVKETQSTFKFE